MSIRARKHSYSINLLIALDQLLGAICGLNADCTISAALGEHMVETDTDRISWKKYPFKAWLQRELDKIQKDHCRKSYYKEIYWRDEEVSSD